METPTEYTTDDKTIFRKPHNREHPYVVISKTIFEDDAISWKAKGLMGYLLSRPDDWTVRLGDLVKRSTDGRSAVRSALKELEKRGYLTKNILRDEHGQWAGIEMIVSEHPQAPVTACDFPTADNPTAGNPQAENRTLLNTDHVLSTDSTKREGGATAQLAQDDALFYGSEPKPERPSLKTNLPQTADPLVMAAHCQQARERETLQTVPQDATVKAKPNGRSPAVLEFKRATGYMPPPTWREEIAERVGDEPDRLKRWYDTCFAYVGNGWNPRNVKGMLDHFVVGAIPDTRPENEHPDRTGSNGEPAKVFQPGEVVWLSPEEQERGYNEWKREQAAAGMPGL